MPDTTETPRPLTPHDVDALEAYLDGHTPDDGKALPGPPLGSLWPTIVRQLIQTARDERALALERGERALELEAKLGGRARRTSEILDSASILESFVDEDPPEPGHTERLVEIGQLAALERIAEALEGLAFAFPQVLANGSPLVNAILDAGHGRPPTTLDDDEIEF